MESRRPPLPHPVFFILLRPFLGQARLVWLAHSGIYLKSSQCSGRLVIVAPNKQPEGNGWDQMGGIVELPLFPGIAPGSFQVHHTSV